MKTFYLSSIILLTSLTLKGQDILQSNFAWTVTQLTDLNTQTTTGYQCTFNTHGAQSIDWVQKKITIKFDITDVTGVWADVNVNGKIIFDVSAEGETGTLTFEKDETGTFITLDLSQQGGTRLKQRYTVTQVN